MGNRRSRGRSNRRTGSRRLGRNERVRGDPAPVDGVLETAVRRFNQGMLRHAAAVDPTRWYATAAAVSKRFRVCGLAAAYTMLHAIGPARGEWLKYDLALDERRTCGVSFASMVFRTLPVLGQPEVGTDL